MEIRFLWDNFRSILITSTKLTITIRNKLKKSEMKNRLILSCHSLEDLKEGEKREDQEEEEEKEEEERGID